MIKIEKVQANGFTMDFFRFGTGDKTMVILPGLSVSSVMNSAELIAESYAGMKDDFTVFVFDRRNELPSFYSVYDMACDTVEAMNLLGLCDVYLFGASQGGMVALDIAIEFPQIVKKAVIASSSPYVRQMQYRQIEKWIDLAQKKDRTALYLEFAEKIYPPDMFKKYENTFLLLANNVTDEELERFSIIAQGSKDFDVSDRVHEIQCPVLAIGAKDDAVLGGEATFDLANELKGRADCKTYMYDGYGHAAYDVAPDYKQRILDFFLQ